MAETCHSLHGTRAHLGDDNFSQAAMFWLGRSAQLLQQLPSVRLCTADGFRQTRRGLLEYESGGSPSMYTYVTCAFSLQKRNCLRHWRRLLRYH